MKTAKERMWERMRTPRVMTSISLRIPENVIETLKEIAPMLGFSGYQTLIKAYISQGLRRDLERLEGSQVALLTESLRRQGVADELISAAIAEAGLERAQAGYEYGDASHAAQEQAMHLPADGAVREANEQVALGSPR
jgi:hypothetical protein